MRRTNLFFLMGVMFSFGSCQKKKRTPLACAPTTFIMTRQNVVTGKHKRDQRQKINESLPCPQSYLLTWQCPPYEVSNQEKKETERYGTFIGFLICRKDEKRNAILKIVVL